VVFAVVHKACYNTLQTTEAAAAAAAYITDKTALDQSERIPTSMLRLAKTLHAGFVTTLQKARGPDHLELIKK
jgi:hypothetical protein